MLRICRWKKGIYFYTDQFRNNLIRHHPHLLFYQHSTHTHCSKNAILVRGLHVGAKLNRKEKKEKFSIFYTQTLYTSICINYVWVEVCVPSIHERIRKVSQKDEEGVL